MSEAGAAFRRNFGNVPLGPRPASDALKVETQISKEGNDDGDAFVDALADVDVPCITTTPSSS